MTAFTDRRNSRLGLMLHVHSDQPTLPIEQLK